MSALNPDTLTLGGLFVAGLATSLHCAGMCGLLTCGLGIAGRGPALASVGIYHFCRLVGYAIAGALFGFIGAQLGLEVSIAGVPWLPILLIGFLIAITFGLDKKLGAIPGLGKVIMQIRLKTLNLAPPARASIIGLATPLLPCGPLYLLFGASLLTGSAVRGAEFALAFGMGTIPLLWLAQQSLGRIRKVLPATQMAHLQRGLALVAALVMLWRLHDTLPFSAPVAEAAEQELPSCCH